MIPPHPKLGHVQRNKKQKTKKNPEKKNKKQKSPKTKTKRNKIDVKEILMKYMIFPFDIRYIFLCDHIVMPMIFGIVTGEGKGSKLIFFWPCNRDLRLC